MHQVMTACNIYAISSQNIVSHQQLLSKNFEQCINHYGIAICKTCGNAVHFNVEKCKMHVSLDSV